MTNTRESAVEATGPREAFQNRDFRVFWTAALVSNIGSWMQNLAVPFVIYEATKSVTWVGVTAMASLLPSVPLAPLGGMLADRYQRRKVLLLSQCLFALVAMALWGQWLLGWRNPWALIVPVALGSCLSGINMPSWQAFIYDLVPARILAPSVALNSAQFHLARAIGPAIAGVVLARYGPSWTFLINALSFVTVIGALLVLRPNVVPRDRVAGGIWAQTVAAFHYLMARPPLRTSFLVVAAMAFFGHPVLSLATPMAREVFRAGARGVGVLTAGFGVGAGVGVVLLTRINRRFRREHVIQWGLALYGIFVLGIASARNLPMMFVALIPFGASYLMTVASCNTVIQTTTEERVRGRVLAIYFASFSVFFPVGALLQGAIADRLGLRTTVAVFGAALCAVATLWRRGSRLADDLVRAV
jgi:MFS family permease